MPGEEAKARKVVSAMYLVLAVMHVAIHYCSMCYHLVCRDCQAAKALLARCHSELSKQMHFLCAAWQVVLMHISMAKMMKSETLLSCVYKLGRVYQGRLLCLQYRKDFVESRPPQPPGAWPPQFDEEGAPDAEEFAAKAAEIREAVTLEMHRERELLLETHHQQQQQFNNLAQVRQYAHVLRTQ